MDYKTLKILHKSICTKNIQNGEEFQNLFSEEVQNVLKRVAQEKKERVEIQKCMIQLLEKMEVEAKQEGEKEKRERHMSQENLLNILDRIFSHIAKQRGYTYDQQK